MHEELTETPGWLHRELQGSNCLHLPHFWDYKHYATTSSFFTWLLGLQLRSLHRSSLWTETFLVPFSGRYTSFLKLGGFKYSKETYREWCYFVYIYRQHGKQPLMWHTHFLRVSMADFYLSLEWTSRIFLLSFVQGLKSKEFTFLNSLTQSWSIFLSLHGLY